MFNVGYNSVNDALKPLKIKLMANTQTNKMNDNLTSCLKPILLLFPISLFLIGCIGAGTLGGWDNRIFPVSEKKLEKAVDVFYKNNPKYRVPEKWLQEDSSMIMNYSFLKSRTFYFDNIPEEMYYITFVHDSETKADTNKSILAIRAINLNGRRWYKKDEVSVKEQVRVQKRFDSEIILTLEHYLHVKAENEAVY